MIIGLVDEMSSQDVAHLSDWADHHARTVPDPTWKRAYALIREGCDLLLRRRAMATENDGWEENPSVAAKKAIRDEMFPVTRSVPNLNNTNGPHIAR
jgi:hypothetical protein